MEESAYDFPVKGINKNRFMFILASIFGTKIVRKDSGIKLTAYYWHDKLWVTKCLNLWHKEV